MHIYLAGYPGKMNNYEAALRACGFTFDTGLELIDENAYDGLLLPGGCDIHPSCYGQKLCGSRVIDEELDQAQFRILERFEKAEKPVLGICRGMQVINVYFGGDLIQHLDTTPLHQDSRGDVFHPAQTRKGSVLWQLYGETCLINSSHHQSCHQVADGFVVTQIAPDGVVEAIEHTKKPVLAVQWHPERTGFAFYRPPVADGAKIFQFFFTQTRIL